MILNIVSNIKTKYRKFRHISFMSNILQYFHLMKKWQIVLLCYPVGYNYGLNRLHHWVSKPSVPSISTVGRDFQARFRCGTFKQTGKVHGNEEVVTTFQLFLDYRVVIKMLTFYYHDLKQFCDHWRFWDIQD